MVIRWARAPRKKISNGSAVVITPRIHRQPLPYEGALDLRRAEDLDLVVIHCTELPDLEMARSFGEKIHYPDSGTGNSGHFYIDRDGRVEQWADPLRTAHHARGFNARSIGIELVNTGRFPDWLDSRRQDMKEAYPDSQLLGLEALLDHLCVRFSSLRWIAGHEELDTVQVPATNDPDTLVRRKRDPGPLFPWNRFAGAGHLQRFPDGKD